MDTFRGQDKTFLSCCYRSTQPYKLVSTTWHKFKQAGQIFHLKHSHKKQKNSLEGSLDRLLLAVELEFPKILVPRPPQYTSSVNIEFARKSKQLYSLCYLEYDILNFIILILICF